MQWRNSAEKYGAVAKTLHWLIALVIFGMIGLGLYMEDLPRGPQQYEFIQLHKSFGITLLALVVLRLLWRLGNPAPPLPLTTKGYEKFLAHLVHVLLYVAMIVFPLSGWIMISASDFPTGEVFGLFTIPDLIGTDREIGDIAYKVHETMLWVIAGLLALHILGALKHHFISKDDVLRRMSPGAKLRSAWSQGR
ncbi:MAG: cytochrome b [Rhodospirillaceae bacterium]|nr:cytochrome b [Rhodospirillaceae bacterium]